jgi:hypothetical protein
MAITTEMLTSVLELYTAYFNRVADKDGVDHWLNEMDSNGWTIDQVAQSFADQSEYTDIYAGMTNAQIVSTVYGNVLDRAADSDGAAYWESELANGNIAVNQLVQAVVAAAKEDVNGLGDNETLSAKVQESFSAYYTGAVTTEDGDTLLTTGQDTLVGGAADDNFTAYIFDNQNTAQSGDSIDGAEGTDTLFADIGNSQKFAITLDTTSVEKFIVRAQADATDSNENNMADNVQIDAERMDGTNWYESNNSRSDVVIEDVRIEDSQTTKDITIAMVDTDPGDVDMAVYFDQCSLRANPEKTIQGSTLEVKYIYKDDDKINNVSNANNIEKFIHSAFKIYLKEQDGVLPAEAGWYTIRNEEPDITNYDELVVAIQDGITMSKLPDDIKNNIVVSKGAQYYIKLDENDGGGNEVIYGYKINITSSEYTIDVENGTEESKWFVRDAQSGLKDDVIQSFKRGDIDPNTQADLITSTILLDGVGRGSMGGDLVVGGLSTGDSSDSMGVERFEITVEGSSELQTINSTNNTLREVEIVNGTESGNLTVTGDIALENDVVGDAGQDNAYGLSDVRVIEASEMTGSLTATVELTAASVDKFLDTTDIAENTSADNSYNMTADYNKLDTLGLDKSLYKTFTYNLGTNSDSFAIDIDGSNLEQSGTTNREDFVMVINGNAGNDTITTNIINADSETSDAAHWYQNSKFEANLTINAGEGDDTINTIGSGDFIINGGAGNDTIYTDNTGEKATWIFNDADIDGDADVNIDNILADTSSNTYAVSNATLTVTYYGSNVSNTAGEGYEVQVSVADNATDLQVNQAIKEAINNDEVLSKLLFAQDSQGNSIVVDALTDGVHVDGDLTVSMDTTSKDEAVRSEVERFNASVKSDFELAVKDGADMTGSDSVQVSDNTITAGAGTACADTADKCYDVIVLGTDADATTGASNDIVVYEKSKNDNDVIVNFVAGDATTGGVDVLDFTAFDNGVDAFSVSVVENTATTTGTNTVYLVKDAIGDNTVTIKYGSTEYGTIEFVGTDVDDLTASNFATSTIAAANGIEVPPPEDGQTPETLTDDDADTTFDASDLDYKFTFEATGTDTFNLSGFGSGDTIVVDDSYTIRLGTNDGGIQLGYYDVDFDPTTIINIATDDADLIAAVDAAADTADKDAAISAVWGDDWLM